MPLVGKKVKLSRIFREDRYHAAAIESGEHL